VQAMIGEEIARYIHRWNIEITASENDLPVDLIKNVGIGGNYLGEIHTAENFKENIWMPQLIERALTQEKAVDRMIDKARQRWSEYMKEEIQPSVSDEQFKEIDKWKQSAIKVLSD